MHLLSNINILEGENSMTINTGADWFGIHYAVLSSGEINIEVNDYEMDNTTFNLKQNYPNPFTTNTTISFSRLKDSENTYIVIYNIKGQQVKKYSIFNNQSSISWDGKDENGNTVIPGLYFYKLSNGKESQTKKMILIRK
ncbi:MAG TPA: T9SS type A sorting domain-containing protein [Candidatus Cloacimonetes bacterium]|nr:T9SS type A sorting domain-containing protein [Candidatus Cloacimonadota bacterium]